MVPDWKKEELSQTVLIAAIRAFQEHYQMTDGEWISETPEYWYTSSVAKYLSLAHYVVSLEHSAGDVRYAANRGKKGRPRNHYRSGGKVDLTIWGIDDQEEYFPDALVEVKRGWSWNSSTFVPDLRRLTTSLVETGTHLKNGTISFGIFLIVTDACDGKTAVKKLLKKRFKTFKKHIKTYLQNTSDDEIQFKSNSNYKLGSYYTEDESMPAAYVFLIEAVSN